MSIIKKPTGGLPAGFYLCRRAALALTLPLYALRILLQGIKMASSMSRPQFFWFCLRNSFRGAFGIAHVIEVALVIVGGAIAHYCPGLNEQMALLIWLIPLIVFVATFAVAWAFAPYSMVQEFEKSKKRRIVEEINKQEDFEKNALPLYYYRMPDYETHRKDDLLRWFNDEQKRKKDDNKWREFFLAGKKDGQLQQILFATYLHNFVNIYGFTYDKKKSSDHLDRVLLESELLNKIADMVERLPQCYGILIEIDKGKAEVNSADEIPLKAIFDKKLAPWKMQWQLISLSFILPDLSGTCDPTKEREVGLFYIPSPFHRTTHLYPYKNNDKLTAIGVLYDIYLDSFSDDPQQQTYIAGLKSRVLAAHTAQFNSPTAPSQTTL